MSGAVPLLAYERSRLMAAADAVAVLLAISLPWSTSATGILAVVYIIVALPLLRPGSVAAIRTMPAGWLPLALVALALLGLLWGEVPQPERFAGLSAFAKLLLLPLLLLHLRQSDRALWVIFGYIASCTALLVLALVPIAVPPLQVLWRRRYVPVKDYISQSGQFLICAFAILYLAVEFVNAKRRLAALAALVLALLFLADIVYVRSGRTAFVIFPVLVLLLGLRLFGWKGLAGAAVIGLVVAALAWASSPYLRARVGAIFVEVNQYRTEHVRTSSGERLEFWKKSLRFIAEAPIIGHGTGSIPGMFRGAVVGVSGPASEVTTNPHNQTLAVGIQLGLVGIALLWAMWIAHLLLFRGEGFAAWFGLVVVASNIVGSLFNSHISDFTQGWVYVVLVGAAGGAVMGATRPAGESVTAR
jgi:O-antigen ligase